MRLWVGTSGYSYKEWKGSFYPDKLPATKMLSFYGERFDTVEINNTFYRMPKGEMLQKWAGEVPDEFRFVLKASQQITHIKRLKDVADSVEYLAKTAGVLGNKLGPLLFQLPPNMKKDTARLRDFLTTLPKHSGADTLVCRAAFEFRHASWFDDEIFSALREHDIALCVADADSELEVPFVSTAGWGYLRLRRGDYGDDELKAWRKKVQDQAWSDAFVFFKHEEEGKGPAFAERFAGLGK